MLCCADAARRPAPRRYDVFLFSRPDTLLALASLPVVKVMQMRYVNDSVKAMKGALAA